VLKSDEVEAFKEKTDDRLVSRCPVVLPCVEHSLYRKGSPG